MSGTAQERVTFTAITAEIGNVNLDLSGILPFMSKPRLVELERRVDLALKGMNLLLFGKAESISRQEKKEIQKRLRDYVAEKSSEFVELKDLQGTTAQESS